MVRDIKPSLVDIRILSGRAPFRFDTGEYIFLSASWPFYRSKRNHQADLKLPETNVRILGLNLLAALQVDICFEAICSD